VSGVVGLFSEGGLIPAAVLDHATRSLHHRGPDDRQTWMNAAGSIALGHTRLGVSDPEHGKQPVTNEDGSITAVMDGALYDFERIRSELSARGHQLRTRSDSEILVHLYEEHGVACVEHLRGEFAFVLYDGRRDILVAARDRCGVKPLVYGRHDGVLFVASEAKALLAAGLPAAWNVEAFLQSCVLGSPLEDATVFAGIQRLPAGHLLMASRGHQRVVRYWDLDYPRDGDGVARSEREDHEALAATLTDAVRLRLRAEVPIACYLGGLDASTVLGLATSQGSAPMHAFSVAIDDHVTEEHTLARQMAVLLGVPHTIMQVRSAELARDFEDVLYYAEQPLNNVSCGVFFQNSRSLRDAGFKIVLTGEGSDEMFAGYAHYRRDLDFASRPPQGDSPTSPAAASHVVASPQASGPRMSGAAIRAALGGFIPTWLRGTGASSHGILDLLHPALATRLVRGEPYAGLIGSVEVSRQLRGRHPVHQSMYLWSKLVLPSYLLSAANDAMQMAHGIECRLPFLDHHVVELSTRLPIDRLIRGGVEKYLLREVARPFVTDAIYRRPKCQIVAPEAMAIGTRLIDELIHDTLRGSALSAMPFFDRPRVIARLDSLPDCDTAVRAALNPSLCLVLSACLLQQRFKLRYEDG
jgi:asparagine synthase (glutamine-hydrolysing)